MTPLLEEVLTDLHTLAYRLGSQFESPDAGDVARARMVVLDMISDFDHRMAQLDGHAPVGSWVWCPELGEYREE